MRTGLYLVLGLAAGLLALKLLFHDLAGFHARMDFDGGSLEDFRDFYYPTGRTILTSGEATGGFLYPPSFALALAPLGRLDEETAVTLWAALELAATAAVIALGLALLRPSPPLYGAGVFIALTSVPLAHNLHWGQVSSFIALLLLGALACERRGRQGPATVLIALAGAIKLYPLLYLTLPALRREWSRVGQGLLLALVLIVLLPALILGPAGTGEFLSRMLHGLLERRAELFAADNAQALGPVLGRWLGWDGTWPAWLGVAATLALLPFLRKAAQRPLLGFAALSLTLPLFVEPHWPHYFTLLPFAELLVLARGDRLGRGLAMVSCLLASLFALRLFPGGEAYGASGLLLVADLLLLSALGRAGTFDDIDSVASQETGEV